MGNITGTLVENAFQSQPNSRPALDIQEEIKKLARDSSNQELYRLLHTEMERGAKERTSTAQGHPAAEISENSDIRRGAEKSESARASTDRSHVQSGLAYSKYKNNEPQQIAEHSQSLDRDVGRKGGNDRATDSADEKQLDGVTKMVSDQEESFSAPRMAFKKKILTSYQTENNEISAKVENSTIVKEEQEIKREDFTCTDSAGKNSSDGKQEPLTRVLNFDNCIQVIVMNELQKLDSAPDELHDGKKLQLFGVLDDDSQKNKPSVAVGSEMSKSRSPFESNWMSKIEKTVGQSVDCEPKREKWPQYVRVEPASNQMPAEMSPLRTAARKAEVGLSAVSSRDVPSAYRTFGHILETSMTQEVPRMYSMTAGEGPTQNSRQVGYHLPGEIAGGEANIPRGPLVKYSHPSVWGHSHDVPMVQTSPHPLSAESGYRMTPSSQMVRQMGDHHRKADKDLESLKPHRPEYISYSGPSQHPLISGPPPQHSSFQNSPPMLLEKQHRMDVASYLHPAKVTPRERVHGQYETPYLNQPEGLQPLAMSYLKHSPKDSPVSAYEKDLARPPAETQYNRTELPKTSPGYPSAGPVRNYRMMTDPSHVGYRGERPGRPDIQLDKRTYGMHNTEDFEFEKPFRRMTAGSQDVPLGSEQLIQRSFSTSFVPRVRENVDREVGGPAEEIPLDLTVKKDFTSGHHASLYLLPSGAKQHHPDWEMAKSIGYKSSYVREEDRVHANTFRPASQKPDDFTVPEQVGRREALHNRHMYEKMPPGLTMVQPESDFGRIIPTPVQERNARTSVIASHPFDDTVSNLGPPSHLTMQQMSEALIKNQLQSASNWKPSAYQELPSQGRAVLLDKESSFQSGLERIRPRPNNPNSDLLHLPTTSPTIPHLSPIQPLVVPTGSQALGGRRVTGPSLLGSHSPSDILHLQCKVCGSTYGSLRSFRMHFAKVHGLEPLPEHCNISTISGTKNAMSKFTSLDDNEPPALQREALPSDVVSSGKNRTFVFDQFSNDSRPVKPDIVRSEGPSISARTKQVAEVYPMPVRVTQDLSPQLKPDPIIRRPDVKDAPIEHSESKMKALIDAKKSGHVVNCDLGIIRSRNCYSDLGCDVDCPECLDGFKDISDWKMHISTHMMRSCMCKVCSLSFTHSGALKKHLQTAHLPSEKVEVEYRCLFCREVFFDEKILFQHTQEHEKRYSRVDNVRRESGSSQGYKHGAATDSEYIQMAVPDTTSSDDMRPISGFGENSSNVSPSTDSKGSSVDRKSFADLLVLGQSNVEPDNVRKLGEIKTEDGKACRIEAVDQSGKIRTFHRSDGYGLGCDSGQSKADTSWLSKCPGSTSVARTALSDIERELKSTKASEESVAYVSKKQALLKRFQSSEERQSAEVETSRLSSASSSRPNSSGTPSVGRYGTGVGPADSAEVPQPMHLRDLFSIMGHQVEKSIRGIPDFPPVSSFAPTQPRSRCVRDVCDEIIAQSFRKDNSPRDSVSSVSMLETLELNSNDKMKAEFKTLLGTENQPSDALCAKSFAESSHGQTSGWMGSPCSSRDSYHSLEIDESQFDKERSVEDCTEIGCAERTDVEKRNPTCEFQRPESEQTSAGDQSENRTYDCRSDGRLLADQSFRALESENVSQTSECYFNRRGNLEAIGTENSISHAALMNSKESCSPTSTQKLEACREGEGNPELSSKADVSDQVQTHGRGQKRKRSSSSDASLPKETNNDADDDNEPFSKKPTS